MPAKQSPLTRILKGILFRPFIKHQRLQRTWSRLQTLSLVGMNYGGGGLIETSGELWVLSHLIPRLLRSVNSPIVFDVGANVGDYSLSVLRNLPSAQIYAFEPAAHVFAEMQKRLEQEKVHAQIKPYRIGLSDSTKTLELHRYSIEGQEASLLSSIDLRLPTQVVEVKKDSSESISVQTVDEFCSEHRIDRIHFLKLDVEGHEIAVLRGAGKMLAEGRISIIQFEFGPANIYSRTYFFDFWTMLSEKYDIYRTLPGGVAPISFYGEHEEVFLTTNYLAIKKDLTKSRVV